MTEEVGMADLVEEVVHHLEVLQADDDQRHQLEIHATVKGHAPVLHHTNVLRSCHKTGSRLYVVHVGVKKHVMDVSFRERDADAAIMLLLSAGASSRYGCIDAGLYHATKLKTIPFFCFKFEDGDVIGGNKGCDRVRQVRNMLCIAHAAID